VTLQLLRVGAATYPCTSTAEVSAVVEVRRVVSRQAKYIRAFNASRSSVAKWTSSRVRLEHRSTETEAERRSLENHCQSEVGECRRR
jgi:hypothetical protein